MRFRGAPSRFEAEPCERLPPPFVLVAPSAAWAHAVLQRQGYTVNPF